MTIKAHVILQKGSNSDLRISVEITVIISTETNVVVQKSEELWHVLSLKNPDMPYSAVEAACISGGFFALRKMSIMHQSDPGYEIVINNVSGTIEYDTTPVATAVYIGVAHLIGHTEVIAKDELNGWDLVECRIKG